MARKLEFDIPSDKKVRLVVIAIIVVSIVDVILYGKLLEAEMVYFRSLGVLDRELLVVPFCGLLWIIFAGFSRKHTAGYYFRYRYGQTLAFVLFFTASTLGTNTLFRQFGPTSAGSVLAYYYVVLIFMFMAWGLMASVVAIPIILWRSKIISARSVSKTPVASKKVDTVKRSSQQISQSSEVVKAKPDQSDVEADHKVKTETKPAQDNSNKKSLPERNKEPIDDSADELYAIAWDEVETGNSDKGLWARLYVKHDADEAKTKVAYIEDRVKILFQQRELELQEEKRLEKERQEKEKIRLEEERLEKIRLEEERIERERQEEEKEKRRLEEERLEKKRLDEERRERERQEANERIRLEKVRVEEERLEKIRLEEERIERERQEEEKEKRRLEEERLEKKRLDEERLEEERLEKIRQEKERLEKIRVEEERLEKERQEEEKEKRRLEEERLERIRVADEKRTIRLEGHRQEKIRQEIIQQEKKLAERDLPENRRREVEEKEERELLQRLHEQLPIPFATYGRLKKAVIDSDLSRILLLLVSGANPKKILDDPDDRIKKVLSPSGNKEVRDIIVIATRLWEKGLT